MRREGEPSRVLQLVPATPYEENSIIRTLAPGESFAEEGEFVFDYGSGSLILDEPGTYEMRAIYCDRAGDPNATLESNVWTIQVDPAPDRHRDAFEAYKKLDVASLLTWPTYFAELTSEEILAAIDFLETFPDSPWAKSVQQGLVPAVARRRVHQKASPEELERLHVLLERQGITDEMLRH